MGVLCGARRVATRPPPTSRTSVRAPAGGVTSSPAGCPEGLGGVWGGGPGEDAASEAAGGGLLVPLEDMVVVAAEAAQEAATYRARRRARPPPAAAAASLCGARRGGRGAWGGAACGAAPRLPRAGALLATVGHGRGRRSVAGSDGASA